MLDTAYYPNYFEIDDILATQERVPCRFIQNVPKLGKLNPAQEDGDLKAGLTLDLPAWLATEISTSRQPVIVSTLPNIYKDESCEILKADALAVDLYKFNLYFYELGAHLKHIDPRGTVGDVLLQTFTFRFRYIMDLAENIYSSAPQHSKLDVLEKTILESAHKSKRKLITWLMDSETPLKAANMVLNHKKRKRLEEF